MNILLFPPAILALAFGAEAPLPEAGSQEAWDAYYQKIEDGVCIENPMTDKKYLEYVEPSQTGFRNVPYKLIPNLAFTKPRCKVT